MASGSVLFPAARSCHTDGLQTVKIAQNILSHLRGSSKMVSICALAELKYVWCSGKVRVGLISDS